MAPLTRYCFILLQYLTHTDLARTKPDLARNKLDLANIKKWSLVAYPKAAKTKLLNPETKPKKARINEIEN